MVNYLELLSQFIKTDFKLRYKNSYLGIVWIVLKPLALFTIIFIIWSNIFKIDENYKMGLLLAIIIMTLFSEGIMMGLSSLMNKAGIILKIKFNREVAVFSAVTISLIDFCINMVVFAVFCIFTPIDVTPLGFLLFLSCIISIFILIVGLGLFLSVLFIKLRDMNNLMQIILSLIFWMTPVYYTLEMLPEDFRRIIMLNPLTTIVTSARKGMLTGSTVTGEDFIPLVMVFLVSVAIFVFGNYFFRKRVSKIAEYF